MNKIQYPAIIVVEGTSDEALISSFMDADIVVTNGSDVPRETIEYLKEAKKKRDIVVLTDPLRKVPRKMCWMPFLILFPPHPPIVAS